MNLGDILQLGVRIVLRGTDELDSGLQRVERQAESVAEGAGKSLGDGLHFPLLTAYYDVQALIAGSQQLTQVLGAISGVNIAAQYEQIEVGLKTLTGSQEAADALLKSLQDMGAATPFDTKELVGYTRMLLSTGSTAKTVVKELGTMTDAVAALGLGTEAVGRLSVNLSQIRAGHATTEDYKQFAYLGLSLDKIVGKALGKDETGKGAQELQRMTGAKQYETILKGIDALYGGTAAKAGGTFLGVLQNLGETLQNAVLPTGRLLLPVLAVLAELMKTVAGWVQSLNEKTGGGAGLIALFIGLYRAKGLLIGAATIAAQKVQGLTASISALGVAAGSAAVKTGVAGAEGAAAGAGGAGVIAALRSGAWIRAAGPWLKGLFTVAKVANVGALLASLGLGIAGSHIGGHRGGILSDAGTGLGLGAMIGGRFGPWGLLAGALAGGLIGGIIGARQKDGPKADATQAQIAKNTAATAAALNEMKGTVLGGGARARRVGSQIETEYAVARMMSMGYTTA